MTVSSCMSYPQKRTESSVKSEVGTCRCTLLWWQKNSTTQITHDTFHSNSKRKDNVCEGMLYLFLLTNLHGCLHLIKNLKKWNSIAYHYYFNNSSSSSNHQHTIIHFAIGHHFEICCDYAVARNVGFPI